MPSEDADNKKSRTCGKATCNLAVSDAMQAGVHVGIQTGFLRALKMSKKVSKGINGMLALQEYLKVEAQKDCSRD